MGLGKTRQAIIALREAAPHRSPPRRLPRRGQADLAARDARRRAGRRRPRRDRRRRLGAGAPLDGRQLRPPGQARGRAAGRALGRRDRRRGPLHQERQPARRPGCCASSARPPAAAPAPAADPGRLPAHRHADEQPPARPLQPAQGGAPPPGEELLHLRQALLRRRRQRLRAGHQRAPPTSRSWPRSSPGSCSAAPRTRRSTCPPRRAPGSRSTCPPGPAAAVGRLEARALDYLAANPARSGPSWIQFLGLLNRGRHELAVAKAPPTLEAARERVEAGEKVVVFTSYTEVIDALRAAFGAAAVTITGEDSAAARQRAADALQADPAVRVLAGNLHAAGVGLTLTAATHVLFNDLDWVPGNHWQAEDRIYRIGQTRPAFVTYLYVRGDAGRLRRRPAGAEGGQHRRPGGRRRPSRPPWCSRWSTPPPGASAPPAEAGGRRATRPAPRRGARWACWRRRSTCWPAPGGASPPRARRPRSTASPARASRGSSTPSPSPPGWCAATAPASPTGATAPTPARDRGTLGAGS